MAFLKILAESGPVPGFDEKKRKLDTLDELAGRKRPTTSSWTGKSQEMEKLAAAIEKLEENDLIPVVRLILENQTADMYIKSNVEGLPSPHFFVSFTQMLILFLQMESFILISILWETMY